MSPAVLHQPTLRRLWGRVRLVGWDQPQFYDWLDDNFGSRSLHELNNAAFAEVLTLLGSMTVPGGRVTVAGMEMMLRMAQRLCTDKKKARQYLAVVCQRVAGALDPARLDGRQQRQVTEALKAALKRRRS